MAETPYTYSKQNDFPNQAVNIAALDAEIEADAAINIALVGTEVHLDDVTITFVDALPPAEETALNAVVAAHSGLPLVDSAIRVQNLSEQTTADGNGTWTEALLLTPNPLQGGSWQVTWNAEIALDAILANSGVQARLLVDGIERSLTTSRDDQWVHFAGSALLSLNSGDAPPVKLEFQRAGVANTVKIRRCQIALIPED